MHVSRRVEGGIRHTCLGLLVLGLLVLGMASCSSPRYPTPLTETNLDPGWPKGHQPWDETPSRVMPASLDQETQLLGSPAYVPLPSIPDAEVMEMDDFCETCHETFVKAFANNVHREHGCETCHGGAGLHLGSKGKEPNTILSFRTPQIGTNSGRLISPAERSEVCLQCHEKDKPGETAQKAPGPPVPTWRISAHAHTGVACSDCHRAHYLVPPGTSAVEGVEEAAWMDPRVGSWPMRLARQESPFVEESPRGKSRSLAAAGPDTCYRCHPQMISLERVVHPHQIGVPFSFECNACHDPLPRGAPQAVENHPRQFDCTTCHDPHGRVTQEAKKDLCLKCHSGTHANRWRSSPHDLAGVVCTDCHNPHPQIGPPMHVDQPEVCYRCHSQKRELQQIAHSHQVLGPNRFNCTTCHDPHGKIVMDTRRELCLRCHNGSPTMAFVYP